MSIFNQSHYPSRVRYTAAFLMIALLCSIGTKFAGSLSSQSDQLFNQICTVSGIQVLNTADDVSTDIIGSGDVSFERPCEFCFAQVSQYSYSNNLKHSTATSFRTDLRIVRAKGDSFSFLISHPDHAPPPHRS